MDVVIVGIFENMESSILATLQAKRRGVPLSHYKAAVEPDACQYFEKSRRGPRRDGGE